MKGSELRSLLGRLEETSVAEPSPAFVAKLEVELRAMDQAVRAEAPRPRRARVLAAAVPVAALTAAAAAAAATLLPHDPHPRQVKTADPGVTAPSPLPDSSPSSVPTPTTVTAAPPWLPPAAAPAPPTTTGPTPAAPTPAPRPAVDPAPAAVPPSEPVTTTVAPVTTTTAAPAPETLSLNCGGAMVNGSPAVSCAWSQSSSPSFAWYRLYREVTGTNRVLIFSSDMRTKTSHGDTTVQAGTTYSYTVEATDGAGNVVGRSAPAIVPCC